MRVLVLNGPNLDTLGQREPRVYGKTTLPELEAMIEAWAAQLDIDVVTMQSNHEGEIIDALHDWDGDGVVINPGALTHTSRALADAIRAMGCPVVEVHISNVKARESWRAMSMISDVCSQTVYGRGHGGYQAALRHLVNRRAMPMKTIAYGPHPDNVGDLRVGERGMAVLVHGGIWRGEYTRDTIETLAVDLTTRGFSTWNIEYRRLGNGGGWPGSAHDVLTAFDFIPQLGIDSFPLVVVGHSAGGHLAMWAAPRARQLPDLLVGLAPIVDLTDAASADGILSPEAAELLSSGAPSSVSPGGLRTILVHGEADDIVPVRHSADLAAASAAELHRTGAGHFDLLDPSKPEWSWVVDRLP